MGHVQGQAEVVTADLKNLIIGLEKELLEPAVRSAASGRLDAFLADEFFEFGQSGKRYAKRDILAALPADGEQRFVPSNFEMIVLASDIVLLTYFVEQSSLDDGATRSSWRSSIWKRYDQDWRMLFHQATPVPAVMR